MKIVAAVLVTLIGLFSLIRYIEKRSLYFPLRAIEVTPHDIGLEYEEIIVSTGDGVRISGWFIPSPAPRATILLSHGNGGNISHRLDKIKVLNDLKVNVLIFDYRGYGMSKGRPSEQGLYLDCEAMYRYLVNEKNTPPEKIIGYGESLGGAVIIDLAGRLPLGGIIIEGSFTSIRDMAKHYLPFIPTFVYKTTFNSIDKIMKVTSPKLHFHSMSDDVVPYELGKKLFDNAQGPKKFVNLQGGHNDSFLISEETYAAGLDSFIGEYRSLSENSL